MEPFTFLHWGNIGDVWASLPAVREAYRKTGRKAIMYLQANHPAEYHEGATHPTVNIEGELVNLNEKMIEMIIPLLKVQPYIIDAKLWEGEKIDVDLNAFRMINVGMPNTPISRWYFYAYPDLTCNLASIWLDVPDNEKNLAKDKILINRTERYQNEWINYEFLKPYEDDCLFVGTMREYNNFCMNNNLEIKKLNVNNFLEYAQAVKQSKFYISNQSQGYQICQGLMHPSVLEICAFAANVMPIGENMYDFINQHGLECAFHRLNGTHQQYFDEVRNKNATKEAALEKVQSAN